MVNVEIHENTRLTDDEENAFLRAEKTAERSSNPTTVIIAPKHPSKKLLTDDTTARKRNGKELISFAALPRSSAFWENKDGGSISITSSGKASRKSKKESGILSLDGSASSACVGNEKRIPQKISKRRSAQNFFIEIRKSLLQWKELR
jgi:hypothetical protein